MPRFRRPFAAIVCTAAMTPVGCVSQSTMTGVRIGDETLRQFKAGETTEEWLIAVLGEPTSRSAVEGIPNTEVFRYSLVETTGRGMASLFTGESQRNTSVIYFILTDRLVTRFWADREVERTITGNLADDSFLP